MKTFLLFSISIILSFTLSAQNWVQLGNNINGEAANDDNGRFASLSSDGNTVAIGAQHHDGPNGLGSGQVRIYSYDGTDWLQKGNDIDGEAAADESGRVALSADGNTVVIGAPLNDDNGNGSGNVRVFDFIGTTWQQRGLNIPSETANDQSGTSVGISADGTRVVIGSMDHRSQGVATGQVRVFEWDGSTWVKLGANINGKAAGDQFGELVQISADGTTIIAGAQYADPAGNGTGEVSIYKYNGTDWIAKGSPIPGEKVNGNFGVSVAISADGNTIIAGEWKYPNSSGEVVGRARAFSWNGSDWSQKGQNIDGIGNNDRSALRVGISDNGNIIAVKGQLDDAGASNGKGRATMYHYKGNNWVQIGNPVIGQNTADNCGFGLSFSADGATIVIGSPVNATNGAFAGQARIYRLDGPLGIADNSLEVANIYPNPTNSNFTIDLGKEYKEVTVQISNVLGQVISSEKYASTKIIQQELNASAGIYFIQIRTSEGSFNSFKIIKN